MDVVKAHDRAYELLAEFGLHSWDVQIDKARRRFGQCRYRDRVISLSGPLVELNSENEVEDVIRHEIAHAIAGSDAGHGPRWRAACLKTGARPERCYDSSQVVQPQARYTLVCPDCEFRTDRHRRSRGKFKHLQSHGVLEWIDNSISVAS